MSKVLEVERLLIEALGQADPIVSDKLQEALRLLRESFTEEEDTLAELLEGWDNATNGMSDTAYNGIIKGFGLDPK